jgi:hypothetical protein
VTSAPSSQKAIDIFTGAVQAGSLPLFSDSRIRRFVEQVGNMRNFRVLELGPLEGAHSAMLEWFGASEVSVGRGEPGDLSAMSNYKRDFRFNKA